MQKDMQTEQSEGRLYSALQLSCISSRCAEPFSSNVWRRELLVETQFSVQHTVFSRVRTSIALTLSPCLLMISLCLVMIAIL